MKILKCSLAALVICLVTWLAGGVLIGEVCPFLRDLAMACWKSDYLTNVHIVNVAVALVSMVFFVVFFLLAIASVFFGPVFAFGIYCYLYEKLKS